jgi:hypothetical protein
MLSGRVISDFGLDPKISELLYPQKVVAPPTYKLVYETI